MEGLCDREVAHSASNRQGWNLIYITIPQEFLLAQFILYVHKGGLKPYYFISFFFLSGSPVNSPRVIDDGPPLNQRWFNVLRLF